MPWTAFVLTAKTDSILWGKMSSLQHFSTATVQSLKLLDMAGEVWRKKTGRSAFHNHFVYKTPIFSANTILSTVLK